MSDVALAVLVSDIDAKSLLRQEPDPLCRVALSK